MLKALEAAAGRSFPVSSIEVHVSDTASMATYGCKSIWLRGSYSDQMKRAVLMHELGHCLAFAMQKPAGVDDHRLLFLFLREAWSQMYGPAFADHMVARERLSTSFYDYDSAWSWALEFTISERKALLAAAATFGPNDGTSKFPQ